MIECADATRCNAWLEGSWCCNCEHGGPARCPATNPYMCGGWRGFFCAVEECSAIGAADRGCPWPWGRRGRERRPDTGTGTATAPVAIAVPTDATAACCHRAASRTAVAVAPVLVHGVGTVRREPRRVLHATRDEFRQRLRALGAGIRRRAWRAARRRIPARGAARALVGRRLDELGTGRPGSTRGLVLRIPCPAASIGQAVLADGLAEADGGVDLIVIRPDPPFLSLAGLGELNCPVLSRRNIRHTAVCRGWASCIFPGRRQRVVQRDFLGAALHVVERLLLLEERGELRRHHRVANGEDEEQQQERARDREIAQQSAEAGERATERLHSSPAEAAACCNSPGVGKSQKDGTEATFSYMDPAGENVLWALRPTLHSDSGFHHGAPVALVSQFAEEEEILYPPCTMLVVSPRGDEESEDGEEEGEIMALEDEDDAPMSSELASASARWRCKRHVEGGRSMVVVEVEPSFV